MKLGELARVLGATCAGDQEQEITGVEGIEKAGPGQLTFLANPKYTPFARTTKAGAVLVTEDFESIAAPTLRTANPYLAFARAVWTCSILPRSIRLGFIPRRSSIRARPSAKRYTSEPTS